MRTVASPITPLDSRIAQQAGAACAVASGVSPDVEGGILPPGPVPVVRTPCDSTATSPTWKLKSQIENQK